MQISWPLLLWAGFSATLVVEWLEWLARALGWSRLSYARVVGCLVVARRDARRTWLTGALLNLTIGALGIPLLYGLVFEWTLRADAINGVYLGMLHGALAGVILPLVARAGKCKGPLAAPGLFGWRLGRTTPLALLFTRVVYGAILGYVYVVPPGG